MRVHLLLILFFASTILARSARNKRATGVSTTVQPSNVFTTEANNGNTTTAVSGNKCDESNYENNIFNRSLKMMSKFIKSLITSLNNTLLIFLKIFNSTSDLMLRAMMQPFVGILDMLIKIMEWMLQYL